MLTKSTPVVMTTTALIIVCNLVPGSGKGVGRDEGDGVVRLEPRSPRPCSPSLPCWPPEAPDGLGPRA